MCFPYSRAFACLTTGLFLLVGLSSPVLCQESKPHIAVVLFSNQTNSPSYDAACKAATDTLTLTLNQLGRYLVQPEDTVDGNEDALRAKAAEQNFDFIMYGRMSKENSGGIDCKLSVFDRAKGKTTLSQTRKAVGVLDIFDVTDDLVVAVLESMTGSHIGFGSLTLTNTGEKGNYIVVVDGSSVGSNLENIDKILNGQRTVSIVQKRMLGDREIARSKVEVKEGETVEIRFAVPYLMDDEKQKVERLKSSIDAGWNDSTHMADVDANIAEYASLFGDISYSSKLSTYKDEAKQLTGEWELRKSRLAIENSAWDPKIGFLDTAGSVYTDAKAYPDPAKIKKSFEENAQLLETLLELEAGNALGEGNLDKGLAAFQNALMVSTRYLGGTRMMEYAYAMTMIQATQSDPSPQRLKLVFGPWIDASKRFYAIEDQMSSETSIAVVASDPSRPVSIDGADLADTPLSIKSNEGKTTLSVLPKGADKPVLIEISVGAHLVFVPDGSAGFGKIALGVSPLNAAPGAIAISVQPEGSSYAGFFTAQASLDGGDPVDLPHAFEGVSAGSHVITVPETPYETKRFRGFEETVTVEPGKRLEVSRTLALGRAHIRVEKIPTGATLLFDGVEQSLTTDPLGDAIYDGPIDAGGPKIELVQGNKNWSGYKYMSIDGETVVSINELKLTTALQRKSIKMNGKESEWEGIEPIFTAAQHTSAPNISGSQIAGGSVCRDDKNLYIKINFLDEKPLSVYDPDNCNTALILRQNKGEYKLQVVNDFKYRKEFSSIWDRTAKKDYVVAGSYKEGKSLVEIEFPLRSFSGIFDFSKPITAYLFFGTNRGAGNNQTNPVDIIIGK